MCTIEIFNNFSSKYLQFTNVVLTCYYYTSDYTVFTFLMFFLGILNGAYFVFGIDTPPKLSE